MQGIPDRDSRVGWGPFCTQVVWPPFWASVSTSVVSCSSLNISHTAASLWLLQQSARLPFVQVPALGMNLAFSYPFPLDTSVPTGSLSWGERSVSVRTSRQAEAWGRGGGGWEVLGHRR